MWCNSSPQYLILTELHAEQNYAIEIMVGIRLPVGMEILWERDKEKVSHENWNGMGNNFDGNGN